MVNLVCAPSVWFVIEIRTLENRSVISKILMIYELMTLFQSIFLIFIGGTSGVLTETHVPGRHKEILRQLILRTKIWHSKTNIIFDCYIDTFILVSKICQKRLLTKLENS